MVETVGNPYRISMNAYPTIQAMQGSLFSNKPPGKYNILSLDGGGIRGVMVAALLQRLTEDFDVRDLMDRFNMFAGTSTGSVLACAFAAGLTPRMAVKYYIDMSSIVFFDTLWDNVRDFGMLLGAQYSSEGLEKKLDSIFGDMQLKDLNKKVLIAAYDLYDKERGRWKPKFYHNFEEEGGDGEELVVDVIMRSTAAPVFFPSYGKYIDGGVVANNPSVCAYAQVINSLGWQDIRLLSMGTGTNPMFIDKEFPKGNQYDWGVMQWIPELLYIMMDGGVGIADYQAQAILRNRYFRINPVLPKKIGLDDLASIPFLMQVAKEYDLSEVLNWVKEYIYG